MDKTHRTSQQGRGRHITGDDGALAHPETVPHTEPPPRLHQHRETLGRAPPPPEHPMAAAARERYVRRSRANGEVDKKAEKKIKDLRSSAGPEAIPQMEPTVRKAGTVGLRRSKMSDKKDPRKTTKQVQHTPATTERVPQHTSRNSTKKSSPDGANKKMSKREKALGSKVARSLGPRREYEPGRAVRHSTTNKRGSVDKFAEARNSRMRASAPPRLSDQQIIEQHTSREERESSPPVSSSELESVEPEFVQPGAYAVTEIGGEQIISHPAALHRIGMISSVRIRPEAPTSPLREDSGLEEVDIEDGFGGGAVINNAVVSNGAAGDAVVTGTIKEKKEEPRHRERDIKICVAVMVVAFVAMVVTVIIILKS